MMIREWYRTQKRDFGIASATWLLWRVAWRRARVVASNKLLPGRLECPCCGWKGNRFFDYIEMGYMVRNCACPVCDSHPRHRALFVWLRDACQISQTAGIALVFAPEKTFDPLWGTATNLSLYKVDIEPSRGVDVLADLMCLPFASETVDFMWCHHVLEQVEEDRVALTELQRVLRSGSGELIISVAPGEQVTTMEFGFANKALAGNRRVFGADFPDRLAEAGFKVRAMTHNLTETERRKYGVSAEPFYRCTKD